MKKSVLITLLFTLLCATPSFAQQKKEHNKGANWQKEFVDFKINFLVKEIGLKGDLATKFTNLYTKLENEKGAIYRSGASTEKALKDNPNPTNAQYEAAAFAMTDAKFKEAQIEKNYYPQFKAILSPKQMYLMKKAEHKFQRKLGEMRNKKNKENKGKQGKK